ncbi:MAG: HD domain-containing protein [Acholeplasmatales bacterium]|nr:HD domain-containing protein [Acholeplasmatales bacterium]
MITKEFMDYFVLKFKECYKLDDKWSQKIFRDKLNKDWSNLLYERSKDYRESFEINEEIIGELKSNLHDDLSPLEADILYDAVKDLFYSCCDDYIVLKMIIDPLRAIFKTIGDFNRLIFLLHVLAYEETMFYTESNLDNKIIGMDYYYGIFKYQDKYNLINDRESRLVIFKAYYNLLILMFNDIQTNFNQYFQIRGRALGFWYSNVVQEIDGNDPEFAYYIDKIASNIFKIDGIDKLPLKFRNILRFTYDKYNANKKTQYCDFDTTYGIKYKLDYYDGIIGINDVLNELFKLYDSLYDRFDYNDGKSSDYYDSLCELIESIIEFYNDKNIDLELKDRIVNYVYKHMELIGKAPYGYFNVESNYMICRFYRKVHKILNSFGEKLEFISNILMFRQPITYIHSLMVKNISLAISNKLIDDRPELFINVCGNMTVNDVINNKDKILKYISNASILHDIGKTTCVKIINTQIRRLDELEFKIIKEHPLNGRKVLCNDNDFIDYYDIIEGHHKYYDGSFGYPSEFDNKNSKLKIVIDIVSIADSCDAATDIFGRNYTSGKLFIDLLEELKKNSGVRYNPDVVNYISNDLNLINELSKLTTDGRLSVYEEVYNKYVRN